MDTHAIILKHNPERGKFKVENTYASELEAKEELERVFQQADSAIVVQICQIILIDMIGDIEKNLPSNPQTYGTDPIEFNTGN